jgi:hypothetical protein
MSPLPDEEPNFGGQLGGQSPKHRLLLLNALIVPSLQRIQPGQRPVRSRVGTL